MKSNEQIGNIVTNADVNDFNEEKICIYKNDKYSVRDNGAVLRHSNDGGKNRKTDNIWTFGEVKPTGYMEIATARIHRIVATAFHGEPTTSQHIVDHIDTNRQNNRPENLRWVTRLENILLNPITCKKIELLCGCPIEEVLKDISILHKHTLPPEISWMKIVTQEEAKESLERWLNWVEKPKNLNAGKWLLVGEKWLGKSKTRGAAQKAGHRAYRDSGEFPCCPQIKVDDPLQAYFNNIKTGDIFYRDESYGHKVIDAAISDDHKTLYVKCKNNDATDACDIIVVTYENGVYVHFHDYFYEHYTMKDGKIEYCWPWERAKQS
ncbi:MAG: HNH endonuclease signature motif containing protein [Candidatus Omnitrophica bacterium]|nr:HNH endonuclease signature motif containing protein [Candidatus Omnitrophota bacterium]